MASCAGTLMPAHAGRAVSEQVEGCRGFSQGTILSTLLLARRQQLEHQVCVIDKHRWEHALTDAQALAWLQG